MKERLGPIGLFKKAIFIDYSNLVGRSTRREYWWFLVLNLIIYFLLNIAATVVGDFLRIQIYNALILVYLIFTFIPGIAVSVRRLHDIGRSGWWLLLAIIPGFGWVILFLFFCIDSEIGVNKYGINPKIDL